jgi:hypothetical protein
MRTFMLTWNPAQARPANLDRVVAEVGQGRPAVDDWSVGNHRDLPTSSRVFLVRQGVEPKGVVASGFTTTEPEARPDGNDQSNYCDVLWTMALDDSRGHLLCLDELRNTPLLVNVPWGLQRGGREVSSAEAAQLESLWTALLRRLGRSELPHGRDFA